MARPHWHYPKEPLEEGVGLESSSQETSRSLQWTRLLPCPCGGSAPQEERSSHSPERSLLGQAALPVLPSRVTFAFLHFLFPLSLSTNTQHQKLKSEKKGKEKHRNA